jgi:hypothetical protein
VRLAALEALVDFTKVDGRWPDLEFLLDLAENDPEPAVRYQLVRMLVENPPFERAHKHRLDKEELAERLWNLIKLVTLYMAGGGGGGGVLLFKGYNFFFKSKKNSQKIIKK